jgi:DNA-binding beta-propeller fold protein YncE
MHHVDVHSPRTTRRLLAVAAILTAALLGAPDALGASKTFTGTVSTGGTQLENFSFPVSSPGQVSATLSWQTTSAVLTVAIVDPTGAQVAINSGSANPKTVTYNATLTGTYKVRVKAKSGASSFSVTIGYPGVAVPSYAGQVGGGLTGHAEIYPSGLDVGPDGTVYVADTGNDQVKAYTATGAVAWMFPSGTVRGSRTVGHFSNPRDLTYLNGKVYVDDTGNNRVQVIDTTVSPMTVSAWSYKFPSTLGITAGKDGSGNPIILVSEDTSNQIAVFDTSGTFRCAIAVPTVAGKGAQPRDAATNAAGNVYVAAYQQDQIDEFGPVQGSTCPSGTIRTWGGHGTSNTQLIRPYGVAVNAAGHVFVADSDNERIQEFSGTGGYLATYGGNVTIGGSFKQLRRVALNPTTGAVYGADLWDFHIDRFSAPTLTPDLVYGNKPPAPDNFNEPSGISFDATGRMYVADSVNQRMQVWAPGANGATWSHVSDFGARGWGAGDLSGFNWPRDISYAPGTNTVWVADTKNNRLLEFDTTGASTNHSVSVGGSLTWPYAVDASTANLIVADTFMNKVESLRPDGSGANWSATTANGINLKNPYDVTVAAGVAYVADSGNKRIVELNATTGAYISSFGTANLHSPQGVAVDPVTGSIWVSDTSFNKLVEFSSTGTFIQTFGAAGSGSEQFNHPAHLNVQLDSTGHAYLYVADVYNDRVQILDLNEN